MKADIDKILNLRPEVENENRKLQSVLRSIKPLARMCEKQNIGKYETVPMEILEKTLHGLNMRYGYSVQHITPQYGRENDEFMFFTSSIMNFETKEWIGNAYGMTLNEVVSKIIIRIYWDIKQKEVG